MSSKRRALFGQWKTPPQTFYPSRESDDRILKKSVSTPAMSSILSDQSPICKTYPNPTDFSLPSERPFTSEIPCAKSLGGVESCSCPELVGLSCWSEVNGNRKQRRLARNRASARMRRLRKKTIVETLEAEVVDLQKKMSYLQSSSHELVDSDTLDHQIIPIPMEALLGDFDQATTISTVRRKATLQLLADRQITHCSALQSDGFINAALICGIFCPGSLRFTCNPGIESGTENKRLYKIDSSENFVSGSKGEKSKSLNLCT